MDNAAQLPPQPNFVEAADSLCTVAHHLRLCSNLPAVDSSAQLLAMMQTLLDRFGALERKVDGLEHKFDDKIDAIERKLTDMERRATITSQNMMARQCNSTATQLPNALAPLRSHEDGRPLEGCPKTVQELESLPTAHVDRLLRLLDEPLSGRVEERRMRLMLALGVTARYQRYL